ncbi:hypothetical protein BKA56DRAFT_678567 [Ilyonectria sp. MPI-CAGE-AT-0026]|nr:hypothetical protein BKA56DRAFT_678567 [Ilyonectria sp. MPI-CAGE-AT-0026]
MSNPNAPTQPPVQRHKRPRLDGDGSGVRTAIACRACRERKTRCSGHQPACTYCLKTGLSCVYATTVPTHTPWDSTPTLDEWGDKILTAINSLAGDVNLLHHPRHGIPSVANSNAYSSPTLTLREDQNDSCETSMEEQSRCIPIEGPSPVTSLPSLLAWNVFANQGDVLARFSLSLSEHARQSYASRTSGKESASCAKSDLLFLASVFEARFLPAHPVVDMAEVRGYIAQISEFGILWNTESCLVLLVAALASMYSCNEDQLSALHTDSSVFASTETSSSIECTPGALKYWNMAKKRLAWALEDSGLLAAQCQFLAGVWNLYTSEPAAAWKMFNGSVLAIDAVTLRYKSRIAGVQRTSDAALIEAMRWACINFLCRLRSEEEFSLAPSVYKQPDRDIESQTWGYNDDSALLKIRQNILAEFKKLHAHMSTNELGALHANLTAAERALDNWHERLPTHLRFFTNEEPEPQVTEGEYYPRLLKSRYFETRELILRPSIYVLMHVSSLQPRADTPDLNTAEGTLCVYYAAQYQAMSLRHRDLVLTRLSFFLNPHMGAPLINEGWLKTRTCLSLALLLLAAEHGLSSDACSPGVDSSSVLDAVEDLLRRDCISGIGKVYSSLLHDLRVN